MYGSEIWGTEYSETIERVQVKFCKDYLRLGDTVNNCMALGECGRLPLCCDYSLRSIKYWCKLLMMPPHRDPKQCYIMLRNQDDMGRTNWATAVKSLLYRYGFGLVWLSQDFGNMNLFIMQFNPFPNKPWFLRACSKSLLKTLWEKEKLLVTSNFSFSRSVFSPFGEHSLIFIKFEIVVCKLIVVSRNGRIMFTSHLGVIPTNTLKPY